MADGNSRSMTSRFPSRYAFPIAGVAKVERTAGTISKAVPATVMTVAASARRPTRLLARQQPSANTPKIARMVPP